jgi:hypothetical protein
MTPKILWEKWINPYEVPSDTETELENIQDSDFDQYDNWNTYDEDSNPETDQHIKDLSFKHQTKAIITPMGMIPINEKTACTKTFKFWIGHTNFTISANHQNTIENTEGVETLDIFTRYRFRIAVGKAFQDREVMQDIQDKLYEEL